MSLPAHEYTAVILAGGVGKRFRPFVTDKTLFPFLGKSLLERTIEMVTQTGITRLIIATNRWNTPWVTEYAQQHPELQLQLHQQEQPNGMADALLSIAELLPEQNIIVMNAGDMVEPHLLQQLIEHAGSHPVTVTGMEVASYLPLGYFELSGESVVAIHEKPGPDAMPSNLANLVFHVFSQPNDFLNRLRAHATNRQSDDIYELALTDIMRQGQVGLYRYQGSWQKLKFGYHALDMVRYFLDQLPSPAQTPGATPAGANSQPNEAVVHPTAQIASTAVLHGKVHIAAGAHVYDGAVLQGPCYIGENARIGNTALVRESVVERDAVVGYGSEIVRSYIGPGCDLHHAYVGDSVLEKKVHFGYGAHTANFRFDHQPITVQFTDTHLETDKVKLGALIAAQTELGVNVSLMPGITVGTESIVFPGCVVRQPVPDRVRVAPTTACTLTPVRSATADPSAV